VLAADNFYFDEIVITAVITIIKIIFVTCTEENFFFRIFSSQLRREISEPEEVLLNMREECALSWQRGILVLLRLLLWYIKNLFSEKVQKGTPKVGRGGGGARFPLFKIRG
jgi:hypothetical protein